MPVPLLTAVRPGFYRPGFIGVCVENRTFVAVYHAPLFEPRNTTRRRSTTALKRVT